MEVVRIRKKYDAGDKVQVMFSNAPSQIICSKDGYTYLRDGKLTIHRYLEDQRRVEMPYNKEPSSKEHVSHLLNYGQLYVKFTSSRSMRKSKFACCDGGYELTFLYATKAITGKIMFSEWTVFDGEDYYQKPIKETKFMNREQLEDFLYGTDRLIGKYIFTFNDGIKYAKSVNEEHIVKKDFIDLSDDGIIKLYNMMMCPIFVGTEESKSKPKDEATTIDEVKEFCMTEHELFYNPIIMITITDSQVIFYEFKITYESKDRYRVDLNKIEIMPNMLKVAFSSVKAKYPPEPYFL